MCQNYDTSLEYEGVSLNVYSSCYEVSLTQL